MPELGQVRHENGHTKIYMNVGGCGPRGSVLLCLKWQCVICSSWPVAVIRALQDLPTGTVIDVRALPEVVVLKHPEGHLGDAEFDRLLEMAEEAI